MKIVTALSYATEYENRFNKIAYKNHGVKEYKTSNIGAACRRFYAERMKNNIVITRVRQFQVR